MYTFAGACMGLSWITSGIFAVIAGIISAIAAGLTWVQYHLKLLAEDLFNIGTNIQNIANKKLQKLNGDKNTFTDKCNVIGNDLEKYSNGKPDNLPVSQDSAIDAEENGNTTGTLNATDVDGDGIIYMMDHQAAYGTVTINNNGTYTYASNNNYTGNDSFTYKSNDIYGDSNIATVNVTVHPVNHAPVSNNITFDIESNNNLTGELNSTDADGDPIIYNLMNSTSQGNININANGTFTYIPSRWLDWK